MHPGIPKSLADIRNYRFLRPKNKSPLRAQRIEIRKRPNHAQKLFDIGIRLRALNPDGQALSPRQVVSLEPSIPLVRQT